MSLFNHLVLRPWLPLVASNIQPDLYGFANSETRVVYKGQEYFQNSVWEAIV